MAAAEGRQDEAEVQYEEDDGDEEEDPLFFLGWVRLDLHLFGSVPHTDYRDGMGSLPSTSPVL